MRAMSEKVEGSRTRGGRRFEIAKPLEPVGRGVLGAVQQLYSERWLVEVLAIGLVALLIGLAALCGLAVVSTSVRVPSLAGAAEVTHADLDADAGTVRAVDDPWCLRTHVVTGATPAAHSDGD